MAASIENLINIQDPGWKIVEEWLEAARVGGELSVQILPVISDETRRNELVQMQISTRSILGAMIWESGGIVIDQWLRILGSGSEQHSTPSVIQFTNQLQLKPRFVGVAYDVLGGVFGLSATSRSVWYFAPDSLEWEDLGLAYSSFVEWCLSPGRLSKFYQSHRWSGWREELADLDGSKGVSIVPLLCTEPQLAIDDRSRKIISVHELFALFLKSAKD